MVKDVTNSALQTIQVEYTPAVIKVDREAIASFLSEQLEKANAKKGK